MQQCKCVKVHRSGENAIWSPKGATGGGANWSHEGRNRGKIKEFRLAGIKLYDKRKGNLPLYKLTNFWQPLCCKAFLGNATPRQQHWAYSFQKLPSNH